MARCAEIKFTTVPPHTCSWCGRVITVNPCPACCAVLGGADRFQESCTDESTYHERLNSHLASVQARKSRNGYGPVEFEKIEILYRDKKFLAAGGGFEAHGEDAEDALRELLLKLRVACGRSTDIDRRRNLYMAGGNTLMNVLSLTVQPDLDGQPHFLLDFTTSVRFSQGDLEELFQRIMHIKSTANGED